MLNLQELLSPVFQISSPFIKTGWEIFKAWWWVLPPFLLWSRAKYFWFWWRNGAWGASWDYTMIEIIPPEDNEKPVRAMENVIDGLWQMFYAPPNWYEDWWEGEYQITVNFEIVADGEGPHFYFRFQEGNRDVVEANIYSQYPDAEIKEVEDYTNKVPQNIPNENWDLWGCSYMLTRPDPYPIKTYKYFETESEKTEEKRIDPIASLLEAMGKIQKGEQLWIQFNCKPIAQEMADKFMERAEKVKGELSKRDEGGESKRSSMLTRLYRAIVHGEDPIDQSRKEAEAEEDEETSSFAYPEMTLTPGEREVLQEVERKKSKDLFQTNIRFIYLGNKDVFFKPKVRLPFGFFVSFNKSDCNQLVPFGDTITKASPQWWNWLIFKKRREYVLKRNLFRYYKMRKAPFFPRDPGKGSYVLNVEEMASLYHFPHREAVPAPLRPSGGAKKKGVPTPLPTEEDEEE